MTMHTATASAPLHAWTERLQRWRFGVEDGWFEWRHGLELARPVPHAALVTSHQQALQHATSYQGVWSHNVRLLVSQALQANPQLRHFVDLGSGKGKACFHASLLHRFDSVVGVEFSEPLVAVAQRNLQRFAAVRGSRGLQFVAGDATAHTLPEGATLVFLFNPFDGAVLDRFLAHNRGHFQRHPSLVAYANDVHRRVLQQHGFETVFRDPGRKVSLLQPA
jgi:SAM-dependent methyltransferase